MTKAAPFSRRGFMTAAAATAAGYTVAAGEVRAEAIHTDSAGLETGAAAIPVAGGGMPAYFARPKGVANPPVVLVAMEIFGLHEYIKDVARRLAKLGAFAVAPDYYFRLGADLTAFTDFKAIMPIVNAKPDAELVSDLDAAWRGPRARAAICRGSAWWASAVVDARSGSMPRTAKRSRRASPSTARLWTRKIRVWPKSPMELAPEMKAPVLGLYGEADQGIPVAQVEEMKAALKAAGKTAEFKIYPGAPHAFHADYRPSYRQEAAEDGWRQMEAWFRKYGVLS